MADDLWRHALETLDHYKDPNDGADILQLYDYVEDDSTGILKRHKTLVNNVTNEPKTMYHELIKMLMDFEKQHSSQEAYKEIQSISKIQGYQDLTNRLLRNINERLFTDLEAVSNKLANMEKIMGISDDNFVWDEQPWSEKLANMEDALQQHNDRFNGIEGVNNQQNEDIANLYDRLRTKDDDDDRGRSLQEEQGMIQAKALEVLEKRIDANEEHIDLLEKHDTEQDAKIEDLSEGWTNMEDKLTALESADTYIQESHKLAVEKVQGMEEEGQAYKESVFHLKEDFETYQETKDMNDEKTLGMIETLKENEQKLTDEVEELSKDNVEIKEKLEELDEKANKLENKADDLITEIEKAKDIFKSLEVDQTDSIGNANERLAQLDEILKKLSSDLEDIKENSNKTADEIKELHDVNEKHKDEIKTIENDASTFQEKIYITINDHRDDSDDTKKLVDALVEDVKGNTEKIDALDKNNNILILKVENIEKEEGDRAKGMSDKSNDLEEEIKRLENDVKGNASKIEDGNVIIKRHSEQLYLQSDDGKCIVYEDPHIDGFDNPNQGPFLTRVAIFDSPQGVSLFGRAYSGRLLHERSWHAGGDPNIDVNVYEKGDFWLVKNEFVQIQARYNDSIEFGRGRSGLAALAVGGRALGGGTLLVEPKQGEIVCFGERIGPEEVFSKETESGPMRVHTHYNAFTEGGVAASGIHVTLPNNIFLQIRRYNTHLDAKITMPRAAGQTDGQCGNFNGDPFDDALEEVKNRMISMNVADEDLLFAKPFSK